MHLGGEGTADSIHLGYTQIDRAQRLRSLVAQLVLKLDEVGVNSVLHCGYGIIPDLNAWESKTNPLVRVV